MRRVTLVSLLIAALALVGQAHAQLFDGESWSLMTAEPTAPNGFATRDSVGLPGLRPLKMMSLPLRESDLSSDPDDRMFSWSLEAWQLNTASLAHIQCNRLTPTIDSFVAEDCRFVEDPVPQGSVNLMRVSGQWTAAPGLDLNLSAFSARSSEPDFPPAVENFLVPGADPLGGMRSGEGVDAGISFGIANERVGDFLIGLQVARYRQRMTLLDLGLSGESVLAGGDLERYANSAQLALGWRRGRFSGDLFGSARDVPVWLAPGQYGQAVLNSFDLEFSWQAVRNASITIGVSNVLDTPPSNLDDPVADMGLEDSVDQIYGRIPYVRYKHDL